MTPPLATGVCVLAVAVLVWAERRQAPGLRAASKTLASLAFVAVALGLGAAAHGHGRLMLLALGLSVVGDVLLLSARPQAFLGGLGAFLAAHAAFAVAFWRAGTATGAMLAAAAVALPLGVAILRWLWPHLQAGMRAPVLAYVVTILAMCVAATGHGVAQGSALVGVGAWLFALSDIAVARETFVAPGFVNRAWGLPAYYSAQLMLAWSVIVAA